MSRPYPDRIGLALTLADFPAHAAWLTQGARDVELHDVTDGRVMDGDWRGVAREICTLLDGHEGRRGIHGPFWHLNVAPRDPAVRRLVQDRLNLGLDFAAAVNGTHMVIHSPFDFFGHPACVPGARLGPELQRVHDTLGGIVERAEAQGVTLVLENIYDLHPLPLLTLVQAFQSDRVKLSVDVGHAHLMTPRGGPPPQAWLEQAGPWLGHVHLCDNDTTSDQHLAPGAGTVHWPAVQRALAGAPPEARLLTDVKPAELNRARHWIEHLGQP